jgi:radical SAM protein
VCRHCRAESQPLRAARELDTGEARRVIDQVAAVDPKPQLIFTGGDPLKRPDLIDLVAHAIASGLQVSVSPAVTPLLTRASLRALHAIGVHAVSFSLDGSDATRHDGLRGVPGTFVRTLDAIRDAVEEGLLVQVNTLVTSATLPDLPAVDSIVTSLGAQRWSLFLLVTVGRGRELGEIAPGDCETLFSWVRRRSQRVGGPVVTTTEAPHYRRVVLDHAPAKRTEGGAAPRHQPPVHAHGLGIRDGNGVMFISHCGDICPSGFLAIVAGNVRDSNPIDVYRCSPLFLALREPSAFEGKCGRCEYRFVCGGSRARAWAATGNPLGSDPLCAYEPSTLERHHAGRLDAR